MPRRGPRSRAAQRTALGVALAAAMTFALGVTSSGASENLLTTRFCRTMISVSPEPSPPTGGAASAYHVFAKQYLSYFEKLQKEAPTASVRAVLVDIDAMLTYLAAPRGPVALSNYVNANQARWAADWTEFDKSVIKCASEVTSLLGLL